MTSRKRINVFDLACRLGGRLKADGIKFNEWGYPDFKSIQFPRGIPADCEVWPISKRHHHGLDRARTILCPFEDDSLLYGGLNQLDNLTSEIAHDYYGVCGFDLSVCVDMPVNEQKVFQLLNMLVTGYMITQGARVIPNWRTGSAETSVALYSYPQEICYAAGTLGCARRNIGHGCITALRNIALTRPSYLMVYGSLRDEYRIVLEEQNVRYRVWTDYCRESHSGKYQK